jgi:hypothetical protein
MPRETWSDILAYYLNYIENFQPVLRQTRRFILNLKPEYILEKDYLYDEVLKEEKRSVHTVKAISEFTAMLRRRIYDKIWSYVDEFKEDLDQIDIRDNVIDFLDESLDTLGIMNNITNPDQTNVKETILYRIVHYIMDQIFPQGSSKKEIYDKLIEKSAEFYEFQRYLLKPTTFYREKIETNEIPSLSPMIYRIINEITSLFNLDSNFLEMPEDNSIEIPVIMKNDIFEPFIDSLANKEENAIKRILNRMELRILDGIFIGPTKNFIELTEPHKYIKRLKQSDGKTRLFPQFSNETLILLNLANTSYKRGFLSKELINWISSNIAYLIYSSIIKVMMEEGNIFLEIFLDLKTEEKILPYLMKLICFENYLRIDRTKIRDSVQYRKEIFNTIGSLKPDTNLSENITNYLKEILKKI